MPSTIPIPKFLSQQGTDPKYTTEEYWARLQYSVISGIMAKADSLLDKQKRTTATGARETLSDDQKMYSKVLKGAFLEASVDRPYQQHNTKEKLYLQLFDWIESKWEYSYKSNCNVTSSCNWPNMGMTLNKPAILPSKPASSQTNNNGPQATTTGAITTSTAARNWIQQQNGNRKPKSVNNRLPETRTFSRIPEAKPPDRFGSITYSTKTVTVICFGNGSLSLFGI